MIQVRSKVSRLYSCSLYLAVSSVAQYYLAYSTEQDYSSHYGLLVYRSIAYANNNVYVSRQSSPVGRFLSPDTRSALYPESRHVI